MKEEFTKILANLKDMKMEINRILDNKINDIDKILSQLLNKPNFKDANIRKDNGKEFIQYLQNIVKLKQNSIDSYIDSLDKIKMMFEIKYEVEFDYKLTEVDDIEWFKSLISMFESNIDFVEKNRHWHHILSASYNNYLDFLKYKKSSENNPVHFERIMHGKNLYFFFDEKNKVIGRVPTLSNLKIQGSDNSLYFGSIDNFEVASVFCDIFEIKNITEFDKKSYMMDLNGFKYKILTNINNDGQIQIKVCGDGSIADLFAKYQVFQGYHHGQTESVLFFDFLNMTIYFREKEQFNGL
jgi:hypothetical protein